MSPDEQRRLAIEFGIGQGDSEYSDDHEDLEIAKSSPEPEWLVDPEWLAAIRGLEFGNVEPLVEALEFAEPIPAEFETILALALRGEARIGFRLIVRGAPVEGQKRAGRPRRQSRLTGEMLADDIEQRALQTDKYRRIAAAALKGDERLPFWISVKSNSGGRFPARTGERNLILAVKMSAR